MMPTVTLLDVRRGWPQAHLDLAHMPLITNRHGYGSRSRRSRVFELASYR